MKKGRTKILIVMQVKECKKHQKFEFKKNKQNINGKEQSCQFRNKRISYMKEEIREYCTWKNTLRQEKDM